jgi:hypothetical protein
MAASGLHVFGLRQMLVPESLHHLSHSLLLTA